MNKPSTSSRLLCLAAIATATMLAACQRNEGETAGQKVDGAIASAERQAEDAKNRADAAADRANASADRAADKVGEIGAAVGSKIEDAAITAGVNAELARDDKLSALRIDVDTSGGKVVLSGSAPDLASRDRASQLAAAVKGVTSVDNRLEVRS